MSTIVRTTTPAVPEPPAGTWSNCLVVGGVAYVAGMTARGADPAGTPADEYGQAKAIFTKIRHLIEAAGGAMSDIVKVTIFVTDIKQREKVWQARSRILHRQFSVPRRWCRWRPSATPRSRSRSKPSPIRRRPALTHHASG